METLEFIIYPDGRVVEKVIGVSGSACTDLTAEIESQLGHLIHRSSSADYFYQSSQSTVTTERLIGVYESWT
ncbi:MAG: DUF2997 domain-containing protein [Synechococcales bacterium]|nr:DUF2997 domain-containing protein [Cyanobacteria bacterium REEB444]MEB3125571.1 DUF2997 domain-containing protein [Synechococcales bacterium]